MVKVWDPLVRIFHWSLVAGFFLAYLTEDDLLDLHVWAGYIVLSLVGVRVLWGIVGTKYARFTDFVYSPQTIKQFILDTFRLRAPRYLGHNPAAGAMIIIMLVFLLLTALSGLAVYATEEGAGPLASILAATGEFWSEVFEETHELLANFTILLIAIHIVGVLMESLIHRENLISAMWHGYKRKTTD
jgi:cytochrome b